MRFNKNVEEIANKAEKLTTALTRLMPNHGGPRASRRRGQAMQVASDKNKLRRIQRRLAMRVCGIYRTVSCEAALVIAGVIPIERFVTERLYQQRADERDPKLERKKTIKEWQEEWTVPGKGARARRIIRNMGIWIAREHGEECHYCGAIDTPDHAIFECGHYAADRSPALEGGNTLTQDNLIQRMLTSKDEWKKVGEVIENIMRKREKDENQKEREQR
ncbi:hypothetical protein NQ314_014643 [Rhamnusium bicolor]|uniref:Uncharacterized protein n=1 Tax=Rhamnusium bicolor TaxID=1586634 RepID=A0AAV8X1C1_9CUCU|nr:hypothetical protein NQ314_014643 [Rhamnusium bicolor]